MSNPTYKAASVKLRTAANAVETTITNGKKRAVAKRTFGHYQSTLDKLNTSWETYKTAFETFQELVFDDENMNESSDELTQKYEDLDLKYSEYLADLYDGLTETSQTTVNAPPQQSTVQNTSIQAPSGHVNSVVQLPRIQLPKFDGNYDNWKAFSDLFKSLVHNDTNLEDVQKLHYLKGCLTHDAQKLLRHVPITHSDYLPAWEKLVSRYENKRILINTQVKRLLNQEKVKSESSKSLRTLVDTTEECLQQITSLGVETKSWDVILIHLLVKKLPIETIKLWEEEVGRQEEDCPDSAELPTMNQFKKFLQTRSRVLECVNSTISIATASTNATKCLHVSQPTEQRCPACKKAHFVTHCDNFKKMTIGERRQCISRAKLCFNCFSSKHILNQCTSKYTCRHCNEKHNSWLHFNTPNENSSPNHSSSNNFAVPTPSTSTDQSQNFFVTPHTSALLATAQVAVKTEFGDTQTLRCLIDSGSQTSFITERAVKRLGLIRRPAKLEVSGLNGNNTAWIKSQVTVKLQSRIHQKAEVETDLFVINSISESLPTRTLECSQSWEYVHQVPLADPDFWKEGPVDVLLGAGVYSEILQDGIIKGQNGCPTAVNTTFGWILLGGDTSLGNAQVFASYESTIQDINFNLQKFWEIEEVERQLPLSEEDKKCEEHFLETHERLPNGQYQVRLPFKSNPNPGRTRELAFKQYQALERRFAREPELKKTYTQCIEEYATLGHMVESSNPIGGYHLPHHPVFKDSTTTKVRVVFNGGAISDIKQSLNAQLLTGPRLQPKLFSTLLKWRKYKVAITGDIEKMYRMILLHPDDRKFQQILWKDKETGAIKDYQLTTVTFGTSPAPYLAIKTLQQLAEDERVTYPLASKAALEDFYVDDLLTGADDIDTAIAIRDESIAMLKGAHFNLRKWSSNKIELLQTLPSEDVEINKFLHFDEDEAVKTLGIKWTPKSDSFSFVVKPAKDLKEGLTKRSILSAIASLYDPLGWISPIIIRAKILMQNIWLTTVSWDEPVKDTIAQQWQAFQTQLKDIEQIKIPRWTGYTTTIKNVQLHGFSDASMKAYAAVIYFCVEVDGIKMATLLTSKTKVCPLKLVTLPRLELNASQLLARLMLQTINDMCIPTPQMICWTDSMIVLHWLKSHPRNWKTYVANRVADIQDFTRPDSWRYVPTKDNPADLASRGVDVSIIINDNFWLNGPKWLTRSENEWPVVEIPSQHNLEAKSQPVISCLNVVDDEFEELFCRYSNLHRIKRLVALVLRFIYNCKHKRNIKTGELSLSELDEAECIMIRQLQKKYLAEDYHKLERKQELSCKSKLLQMSPYLDRLNVMRVGGRLQESDITYNQKHPLILPPDHHITEVIIRETHMDTLHGGPTLMLNTLRQKYWLINGKRVLSTFINRCPRCIRYRQRTRQQIMGSLPADRITINSAFINCGLDYGGPIYIKSSSLRNAKVLKAYFCIFVCMTTKAIHLEPVSDLTTDAFIAALRRFVARRGLCNTIYSDCGSNFKGAKGFLDDDIKKAIQEAEKQAADFSFRQWSLEWKFNPPGSPHFGGLWESNVKCVKHHLKRTIGAQKLTFEEFSTLLSQIEAILNSRPLCSIENSIEDLGVLTPGHFLIGRPLNAIPQPELNPETRPRKRWRYLQVLTQEFWKKWARDYLNTLQHRPKWRKSHPNVQVNDIVLIKDELKSPTYWPLGRVIKVSTGNDDRVRIVRVKTVSSEFDRTITKVCVIPGLEEPDN